MMDCAQTRVHLPLEGGGRPASAGRVGVTALQQLLSQSLRQRRHPTLPPPNPPPQAGEGKSALP
jgi:hypothetical protein